MSDKIFMSLNETLELDYLVDEVDDDAIDVTPQPSDASFSLDYLKKHFGVFNPSDTGTYTFNINGQVIEVEVFDVPSNGVSNWRFEQSLRDTWDVDSVYNGSEVGSVEYSTDSKYGEYALDLNGSDAYVDLGKNIGLDPSGSFSIAGWVKMNESSDRATLMSGFSSGTEGSSFDVELSSWVGGSSTDNAFGVHTWNGYVASDSNVVASTGVWEHYCATYSGGDLNGSNISLYVGGEEVPTSRVDSNTNDLSNNSDNFEIGFSSKNTSNINLQSMEVDSVKTFSKVLSGTEVSNLASKNSL